MAQRFAAETKALSSRRGLFSVPQRVLAVLDHEVHRSRSRDPSRLGIKRRLAINHAGHVLDVCESVADRRPVDAILIDDGGEENDRVVRDGVEVVGLLVVFGAEFRDERLDLGSDHEQWQLDPCLGDRFLQGVADQDHDIQNQECAQKADMAQIVDRLVDLVVGQADDQVGR
jgi:hypothetical protein